MWKEHLRKRLKVDEGLKLRSYKDSVGVWTIGWGHTKGVEQNQLIGMHDAETFLTSDIEEAIATARKVFINFNDLSGPRKAVLTNMAFNLGETRLRSFKKLIAAVVAEDFSKASLEMLDSKWAVQVGQRAKRLAKSMSENVYV